MADNMETKNNNYKLSDFERDVTFKDRLRLFRTKLSLVYDILFDKSFIMLTKRDGFVGFCVRMRNGEAPEFKEWIDKFIEIYKQ